MAKDKEKSKADRQTRKRKPRTLKQDRMGGLVIDVSKPKGRPGRKKGVTFRSSYSCPHCGARYCWKKWLDRHYEKTGHDKHKYNTIPLAPGIEMK